MSPSIADLQKFRKLINNKYRINLVLDNLPVTAQDLLDEVSNWLHAVGWNTDVICQ